jgi:hypothetical protein
MTAGLSRWCAPLSETTSLLGQSTTAQLESGVRGNSPAPFGAGERPQGPTYRYLKASHAARSRQLNAKPLGKTISCEVYM